MSSGMASGITSVGSCGSGRSTEIRSPARTAYFLDRQVSPLTTYGTALNQMRAGRARRAAVIGAQIGVKTLTSGIVGNKDMDVGH